MGAYQVIPCHAESDNKGLIQNFTQDLTNELEELGKNPNTFLMLNYLYS